MRVGYAACRSRPRPPVLRRPLHTRRAGPLLHIDVKPGQAPPGRGLARPQAQPSRPELRDRVGLGPRRDRRRQLHHRRRSQTVQDNHAAEGSTPIDGVGRLDVAHQGLGDAERRVDDGRARCESRGRSRTSSSRGVELVTHHHQQGLPSTGPTAVGWRRLKRHAQTQLTQLQQVQFVQAAINGEYKRGELEVGEVFRERRQGDPCLSWCHDDQSAGRGRCSEAKVLTTAPR